MNYRNHLSSLTIAPISRRLAVLFVALIATSLTGCADESTVTGVGGESTSITALRGREAGRLAPGKIMLWQMKGTATGEERIIDGRPMMCFDTALYDMRTGREIGVGVDCLDLATIGNGNEIGGFAITNTSIFEMPHGTLTTRQRTTVQPAIEGPDGVTHFTASMPAQENVLSGTGRYANVRGTARLHGGVDMSGFEEGVVTFNCLFVIELH